MISLRSERERKEESITQEERDARTVFIMQLARNVSIVDINFYATDARQTRFKSCPCF